MLDSWSSKPGVTQVQIYGHIQKTRVKSDTPGTRTARPSPGFMEQQNMDGVGV